MATHEDAELLLKLYELRREPVMREARRFVLSWQPASFDEILALQRDLGSQKNEYWRQVLGYWDMCASLILHGTLDADLFLDCNAENIFIYSKYAPFFADYERTTGVPFMRQTKKLLETHAPTRARVEQMMAMLQAMRQRNAEPDSQNQAQTAD
jgi:hypothetical protein